MQKAMPGDEGTRATIVAALIVSGAVRFSETDSNVDGQAEHLHRVRLFVDAVMKTVVLPEHY
jgi:hypothetical protein